MTRLGFETQFADPALQGTLPMERIIGSGPAMQAVYALARRVAPSRASVLLLGESGTGKESLATAIHALSCRASGPFIKVNCSAFSESRLESELFGNESGAVPGSTAHRTGRLEAARGGTLFLNEINCTSDILQAKLLRELQERRFDRGSDGDGNAVDTRVIAASSRDLAREVLEDRFREDLYWRLNVVPIALPALRNRPEDIPDSVVHFLRLFSEVNNRNVVQVHAETMEALQSYAWPGNVRELQNYVERAVVMADGDEFSPDLLPEAVRHGCSPGTRPVSVHGIDLETLVSEVVARGIQAAEDEESSLHGYVVNRVEKELISQVLAKCNHIQTKTAAKLGINRNTLHKKLKDYDLETPESGE